LADGSARLGVMMMMMMMMIEEEWEIELAYLNK
jgi:hypothetical protein